MSSSICKAALPIDKIILQLKTALTKVWDDAGRELLITVLDEAHALGFKGNPSKEELKRIQDKASQILGDNLAQKARTPVLTTHKEAYMIGGKAVSTDFSFTLPDLDALDVLQANSLFWVKNAYTKEMQPEMAAALEDHFKHGTTRVELAKRLEDFLAEKGPRMHGYFDLLADHLTTRASEVGHVASYEHAGIEYAEIVAVLDARTSPICRHLHGRVIPIAAMGTQRDKILEAARNDDHKALFKAQPMNLDRMGAMAEPRTSKLIAMGVGIPPYHFRCRTTTVAHFQPAETWERAMQWGIDGEIPQRKLSNLIATAKNSHWGTHDALWEKNSGGDGRLHPTSFVHAKKHGAREMHLSMADYNEAAMNLVRRGQCEAFLLIRDKANPYPVLCFYDVTSGQKVVVNLKGQQLATFYIDKDVRQFNKDLYKYDVAIPLPKGVKKWIASMISSDSAPPYFRP